ncbi:hypothetical protein [Croceitalea rosinachiae]|uniref:Lipoprotein n=1 Tax=Croceitalea rosinachiae TaxID=3075596 RepID=A0ABU3A619_9FLAO|nr:hypothetical protein [Croceitalea sp. F388]MDT0605621.1 hypothetical protein [Croceitalea sp. F388]
MKGQLLETLKIRDGINFYLPGAIVQKGKKVDFENLISCSHKIRLISICLLFSVAILSAQEIKTVLKAPEGWRTEIISFPLSFAPEIEFVGFEDIRFAPDWSNPKSDEFWTYHFVWYIDKNEEMTEESLANTIQYYYNGLMTIVMSGEEGSKKVLTDMDKTQSLFTKTKEGFSGKVSVFDGFFTKKKILLYVKVKEVLCKESSKQIIAFDISLKPFDNSIWKRFDQIEFIGECFK